MLRRIHKYLYILIFLSFFIPLFFLIFRIIDVSEINDASNVRSDYILMFIQCILGIFAMILPNILQKRFNLHIPSFMNILFLIFLYCAISLGEIKNYYYAIPHWDTILHTFSGAMLGAFGFSVVSLLNTEKDLEFKLAPIFVAMFSFFFAVSLGVIWEIYEFISDYFFGLNMQKFKLADGTLLIGQEALRDTMKDLIVDCIGAFVMASIGYISLKYKKGWHKKILIKFKVK